jgi:hypothetical protein
MLLNCLQNAIKSKRGKKSGFLFEKVRGFGDIYKKMEKSDIRR